MAMDSMKSANVVGLTHRDLGHAAAPQSDDCEATRIVDRLNVLASASADLREKVSSKMRPLIREVPNKEREECRSLFVGADAPLFRDIAQTMNAIYENLCIIDETLSRIEI